MATSSYGLTPQPVKSGESTRTWLLAGVTALLLLGASSVGLVYYNSRANNDNRIEDRATRIEELNTTIHDLEEAAKDQDREFEELSADVDASEAELNELSPCPDALDALVKTEPGTSEFEDATVAVLIACHVSL